MPTEQELAKFHPPLTVDQAAAYLNVLPCFVRRLVSEGRVAYHKYGRHLRFEVADLDAYKRSVRVDSSRGRDAR